MALRYASVRPEAILLKLPFTSSERLPQHLLSHPTNEISSECPDCIFSDAYLPDDRLVRLTGAGILEIPPLLSPPLTGIYHPHQSIAIAIVCFSIPV